MKVDNRTVEQLREHYEIEKELANTLRSASRQDRRRLYRSLYDELFKRVPLHPMLTQKASAQKTEPAVFGQMKFIKPFLNKSITFLEVGPGDCALSFEAAKLVKQVYAVDVSAEITNSLIQPPNFHLILSDGSSVPLPRDSVDVAYSNQLMEHLHPDDAFEQLKDIYNTLVTGGVYICSTPNRLSGPHDISKYFDEVATGFHMKEYTTLELSSLFEKVGFTRTRVYFGGTRKHVSLPYLSLPVWPVALIERFLDSLPHGLKKNLGQRQPFRTLLGIKLAAFK